MKFSRDDISDITVRQVEPGRIRVGSETHDGDVVLDTGSRVRRWAPADVGALNIDHFTEALDELPETILLGTGWKAAFPPRELVFALARRGIGLETMDTPAACRTFNILLSEGRRAAAFLIVSERN